MAQTSRKHALIIVDLQKDLAFRGFVWVIPARNRIVKLSWNSAGR